MCVLLFSRPFSLKNKVKDGERNKGQLLIFNFVNAFLYSVFKNCCAV